MAQLVVRNIEENIKNRLRQRAQANGRSMEAEIRDILRNAVAEETEPRRQLGSRIANRFSEIGLDEPIAEMRDWQTRIPDFNR
jgi:plasmid stability protein